MGCEFKVYDGAHIHPAQLVWTLMSNEEHDS